MRWIGLLHPMVAEKLKKGVNVCDVGCGNGRALFKLSKVIISNCANHYVLINHRCIPILPS
jgi:hypothetical protein